MAAKKSTSQARPSRNSISARTTGADDLPVDSTLMADPDWLDAIEEERHRLMKAEAILDCVLLAMAENDGCGDSPPHYPSVLKIARDLVNQSIDQLDSVRLKPMIRGTDGVKEERPAYVH
jgi:hypothetical protein